MENNDTDVTLSRKKQALLNAIREEQSHGERAGTEVRRGHSSPSEYEISGTQSNSQGIDRVPRENKGRVGERAQGSTPTEGTMLRYDSGVRPTESTHEHPSQGNDRDSEAPGTQYLDNYVPTIEEVVTPSPERDKDRERELARQRQERYRERQKHAQNSTVDTTKPVTEKSPVSFSLKSVLPHNHLGSNAGNASNAKKDKVEVKLFSKQEAEEAIDNLAYIYEHGSGLLDDLLEIVVRGHEQVQIWQLDEDEAHTLAKMHLDKGRVNKEAAQSARKLLSLYDQLFFIMLLGPRTASTVRHVKEQGGFSFK